VDTVAVEPGFDVRCVFVLGRQVPMASLFVAGRPAPVRPIASPEDLLRARYGGEASSQFVQEHRALLRRLGGDDPDLHVELPYAALFAALSDGEIDVAPDYAGILPTYQRAVGATGRVDVLSYRDCGVHAYGTGIVASGRALNDRRDEIASFLEVAASAYLAMRIDPELMIRLLAPCYRIWIGITRCWNGGRQRSRPSSTRVGSWAPGTVRVGRRRSPGGGRSAASMSHPRRNACARRSKCLPEFHRDLDPADRAQDEQFEL
jgi:hypothetical protein